MSGGDHEKFADWDGAYVLGALTPSDRHAYEQHLEGCVRCRDAVAELAPMPGLLAQIRPERAAEQVAEEADPSVGGDGTVAPDPVGGTDAPAEAATTPHALARARSRRSRRRLLVGAAVAVLVLAVTLPLTLDDRGSEEQAADGVVAVTPAPVDGESVGMRVDVELAPASWGTRLAVTCDYPTASPSAGGHRDYGSSDDPSWYALVVTAEDGTRSQVSSWQGVPGEMVTLQAATAVDLTDIASVSVVDPTGATVLAADVDGP